MRFADSDLLFLSVLFLHVGGAIVAFGPTFAFPLISAMGGKEPQHVNFALRAVAHVANRLVLPLAIFQGVTGVLLIVLSARNVAELWLGVSILLYAILVALSIFVAIPHLGRLIEATSGPPPTPPAGAPPPSGPPPHIAAMVAGAKRNGMIQTVLIVSIVVLMVFKPVL